IEGPRERRAARVEVVHAGPIVGERVHSIRQRVRMDRYQYVGVVQLGKMSAGIQIDRRRVRARQENSRSRGFDQALHLEGDGQSGDRLPKAGWAGGAERWMARIDHDGPAAQRMVAPDLRGGGGLEEKGAG